MRREKGIRGTVQNRKDTDGAHQQYMMRHSSGLQSIEPTSSEASAQRMNGPLRLIHPYPSQRTFADHFLASTTALVAWVPQAAIATASLTILPGFHALDQRSLLGR